MAIRNKKQLVSNKVSKSLLYEIVVKKLMEIIDNGVVTPGEQFPTEKKLVEELGVSQNVLREAFRVLEERGIVISIQGKGRFLREAEKPDFLGVSVVQELERYSLLEIYEVRELLELSVVEMLANRANEKTLSELWEIYEDLLATFKKTGTTKGELKMHLAYADHCGNYFLAQLVHVTIDKILKFMGNSFSYIVSNYQIEYFEKDNAVLLKALAESNVTEAKNAMKFHLNRTKHSVIVLDKQNNGV